MYSKKNEWRKDNHNVTNAKAVPLKEQDSIEEENKINNLSPEWGVMLTIQENLNHRLGKLYWQKYISSAFWNYISTPINFTITLFTALSAGQAGTESSFISKDIVFYLLLVSFVLSIINTFFRLKEKSILIYEQVKTFKKYCSNFEEIYFTPMLNNNDVLTKLIEYQNLQSVINTYISEEKIEEMNYLSEFIFYFIVKRFFSHKMKCINKDERLWYLDGKPNSSYYSRNFDLDMNNIFIQNFDDINNVDKNNNYIFYQKKNIRSNFLFGFNNNSSSKNEVNSPYTYENNHSFYRKRSNGNLIENRSTSSLDISKEEVKNNDEKDQSKSILNDIEAQMQIKNQHNKQREEEEFKNIVEDTKAKSIEV